MYNDGGVLALTDITVTGNSANNGGGLMEELGTITLTDSTVSNNTGIYGGGLWVHAGTTTASDDTFIGNHALNGGAVQNSDGTLTLTNDTLNGNTAASNGGGFWQDGGSTTFLDSTIAGDRASTGGGIVGFTTSVTITNTIVATNTASTGPDVNGSFTSDGHNLIGKTDSSTGWVTSGPVQDQDQTGTIPIRSIPIWAPLANNGGPTETMALLPGSPAIGKGSGGWRRVTTDQRSLDPRLAWSTSVPSRSAWLVESNGRGGQHDGEPVDPGRGRRPGG